jgi:DNA-binding IclR family transcriptional regulator
MRAALTTLRVLETVAELQPVGVSAVARAADVPKSTAQRCLVTLREAGWLTSPAADRPRWVLTGKALAIGLRGSTEPDLRAAALPVMHRLRQETRETIHLSSFEPRHAPQADEDGLPAHHALVIVERLDSIEAVRTWVSLGTRVPLHASCSGRAVLAALPDGDVDQLLAGPLERYSERTLCDRAALDADLRAIRALGYATVDGGWRQGVGAVAAALRGARGEPVGALAISMPGQRYDEARARRLGPLVARAAAETSAELGARSN